VNFASQGNGELVDSRSKS